MLRHSFAPTVPVSVSKLIMNVTLDFEIKKEKMCRINNQLPQSVWMKSD